MEELSDGEIVWVKLRYSWWPGEVMDEARLPDGFLTPFKKKPLVVVKFFQEDSYEFVKNPSFIFKYNCPRKGEFLRKGLEQCRAKNKHMETFPAHVMHAERMTGGDPDIVNSTDFQPQKKERYSGLFQDARSPAAKGKDSQKGKPVNLATPTTPVSVRKPTHAVRILPQSSGGTRKTSSNESEGGTSSNASLSESVSSFVGSPSPMASSAQLYRCYNCNYSAIRQNLIVLHMKHCRATGVVDATPTSSATVTPSPRPKAVVTAVEIRLDDTSDDEESGQQEVGTTSVGRKKRSLVLPKEQNQEPIVPKQTGRTRSGETVARNRVGRTPKQTSSVGQRKNRRTQPVKKDDEEVLLVDADESSAEICDPTEADATDQHRVQEEKEESSSKIEQKSLDEGVGKKAKTDVKLKNELLADWSEDEQDDVPDGGDKGVVEKKVEPIVPLETSVSAKSVTEAVQQELSTKSKTSRNEKEESMKAATPLAQNHVSKTDTGASEGIGEDNKRNSVEDKEKATEHGGEKMGQR